MGRAHGPSRRLESPSPAAAPESESLPRLPPPQQRPRLLVLVSGLMLLWLAFLAAMAAGWIG